MKDKFIFDEDKILVEERKLVNYIEGNNDIIKRLSTSFHRILNLYSSDIVNNINDFNSYAINTMNNFSREMIETYDFIRNNRELIMITKNKNIINSESFEGVNINE